MNIKKLPLIIKEIERHLELIKYEKDKLSAYSLDEDFENLEFLTFADAFVFRFIKLQSSMGEKLFPLLFEILTGKNRTEATFIDILNTLEKYEFLDAKYWNKIRKLKNEFVHIYPWEIDLKIEALKNALNEIENIERIFNKIKKFCYEKGLL
jgi:hypothetical protein